LRERRDDILPLAAHFLAGFGADKARIAAGFVEVLERYLWPGNVRELRNAMERAALLSHGNIVLPEHLPARVRGSATAPAAAPAADSQRLDEVERDAILAALRRHDFNRTETAKALAISRRALTYKLQRMRAMGLAVDRPGQGGDGE